MDALLLYQLPPLLNGVLIFIFLILAIELGFRFGLRRRRSSEKVDDIIASDITLGALCRR